MPVDATLQSNKDADAMKLCKELEKELDQLEAGLSEVRKDINELVDKKKMVNIFQKIINLSDN